MIVGMMSTYLEGRLATGALRSLLPAVQAVGVCEGAVEGVEAEGPRTPIEEMRQIAQDAGVPFTEVGGRGNVYADDAAKRNACLRWAKQHGTNRGDDEPLWCVWIDGDEIMLWAEYLPDMIGRAQEQTAVGGFPLRIVELDGSVANSYGRVFRAEPIRKYLVSLSQVELHTGVVVGLPNLPICGAGGIPVHPDGGYTAETMTPERQAEWLAVCRPPVAGEPHYLHRSLLRSASRKVERQHVAEARAYEGIYPQQGAPPG